MKHYKIKMILGIIITTAVLSACSTMPTNTNRQGPTTSISAAAYSVSGATGR